jgi:hypothetical protein
MISQGWKKALSMTVYINPLRNPVHLICIIRNQMAEVLLMLDEFFCTKTVRPAKNFTKTGVFSLL